MLCYNSKQRGSESLKVTTEKLEKSQVALQVEVEAEILEQSLQRAYRRLVNRTQIPGFRRGKAPRPLLERHLGKAVLLQEALEILVPEAYEQAIKEQTIPAIGQPEIEILQTEPSVSFKATVAVEPTVELGDYKQLSFSWQAPAVTEDQREEVLKQLLAGSAAWEPSEEPVKDGDMVTIALDSHVETEEGPQPFVQRDRVDYIAQVEDPDPVPGFAKQLVGVKTGETKEFSLAVPEDYSDTTLAGKSIHFTVSLSETKTKKVAALDDAFAKSVGAGFESLEALKEQIRKDLIARGEREAKDALELQVIDAIVGLAQIEYPEILVEHEIEHLIQLDNSLPRDRQGRMDEYLSAIGKSPEEFRNEYREEATKRVLRSLILEKLTELEEIAVSDEEVGQEIDGMTATAGEQQAMLKGWFNQPERRASIESSLIRRKTMQRLLEQLTDMPQPAATAKTEEPAEVAAPVTEAAEEPPAPEAKAPTEKKPRSQSSRRS